MSKIRLPFNFEPRQYQLPLLSEMDSGINRAFLVWSRRSGKDKVCLNYMIKEAWKRKGLYAYLFPTYKQARKVIWNGMDRSGFRFMDHIPEAIRERTNNTDMAVYLKNGSMFQLFGTDDIDDFMGTNPVGVVFSEYSLQAEGAWDYVRPILRENKGWAIFNMTPRGRNHAFRLMNAIKHNKLWFYELLTIEDMVDENGNQYISNEDIQEDRDSGMSEAMIQQEYYCSFDAYLDACYFKGSIENQTNTARGHTGRLKDGKFVPDPKGPLEIWDFPHENKDRYTSGGDFGEGLERDYSVGYIYDRLEEKFVARLRSNKIDSNSFSDLFFDLCVYYKGNYTTCYIVPERTGSGITVCKNLMDKKAHVYFNMVPAKTGQVKKKIVGWVETRDSKYAMMGDLKKYFKTHDVPCAYLIQEATVFIEKESGKIEAESGFNDDCVIAAALALQGSYILGDSPSKPKAEKTEEVKLDNVSKSANMEYEHIVENLAEDIWCDW